MPLDPKVVHLIDQYQGEVMEFAHGQLEEGFHANGACSNEFPEWVILMIDAAIMAGANGAMIALANAGRIRSIQETVEDEVLAGIMRKLLTASEQDGYWATSTDPGDSWLTIDTRQVPLTESEVKTISEVAS